jgi:hypothetical protein
MNAYGWNGIQKGDVPNTSKSQIKKARDSSSDYFSEQVDAGNVLLTICGENGERPLAFPDDNNHLDGLARSFETQAGEGEAASG